MLNDTFSVIFKHRIWGSLRSRFFRPSRVAVIFFSSCLVGKILMVFCAGNWNHLVPCWHLSSFSICAIFHPQYLILALKQNVRIISSVASCFSHPFSSGRHRQEDFCFKQGNLMPVAISVFLRDDNHDNPDSSTTYRFTDNYQIF